MGCLLFVFNPVLALYVALLSCSLSKISFTLIPGRLIFNLRKNFLPPNLLNLSTGVPIIVKILLKSINTKGA